MIRSPAKLMRDLPFGRKILLYGAAVSLISLLLSAAGIVTYDVITSRRAFADRIVTRADMLAQLCGSSLAFNDQTFATHALNALRKKHDVRAACLYNSEGSEFASISQPGEVSAFPRDPVAPSLTLRERHVEVCRPIGFGGQQVGIIYMKCRNDELADRFGGNMHVMTGVFLASLAVALLLCLRFQRVMVQPVLELERVAQAVSANKDYTARAIKFGDDELGRLTGTINGMIEGVQTTLSALQESESRLTLAVKGGNIGFWDWNLITKQVFLSPEWKRQIGYEDHEISAAFSEWESRVHPEDLDSAIQSIRDCQEGRTPKFDVEFRLRHKNGSYRRIVSQGMLISDAQKKPVRMIGTHVDITARKQAEEALRASEKNVQLIIDTSPVGICTVDPLGNYITTNLAYERMLGYSKEELRELSFFEVTHPEDRPANKKLFQDMMSVKTAGFFVEKRYVRKDGTMIEVAVHASGILNVEGNTRFGTAFIKDITKRKLAEITMVEQLDELTRWRDAMVGREDRVIKIKQEVNALLTRLDEPPRYASATEEGAEA